MEGEVEPASTGGVPSVVWRGGWAVSRQVDTGPPPSEGSCPARLMTGRHETAWRILLPAAGRCECAACAAGITSFTCFTPSL